MSFFRTTGGILGINARNLEYLYRYNSSADKQFADNKIFTKNFLQSRGVGVAKLYQVIKRYAELDLTMFDMLPESFVIKPNRGFGGGGILVITKKQGRRWVTSGGEVLSRQDLYRHCVEILEGKYSISGVHDEVVIEERLDPHESLRPLYDTGLPDVRVIVFNMVPVMAMIRVPTYESEGKANMELGAIALGIDVGTGKTTGGAQHSKYIRRLPNGTSAVGFEIPHWDEILHAVSKIQQVTNIGFLGVDLVVTKTGVKVLELNARAGLKIQIANRAPLRTRLKKVSDLKVLTPEDGVAIGKQLFSERSTQDVLGPQKPVVGIQELVTINAEKPLHLTAQISLGSEKNIITSKYYEGAVFDITLGGNRLKLPVEKGRVPKGVDMVLAAKFLSDFYIDPGKKTKKSADVVSAQIDEKMIKNIDQKVGEIDEQIKILAHVNPRNLSEQKQLFFANSDFSPRFTYRPCELDTDLLSRDLRRLPEVDHVLTPLFHKKIEDLDARIGLLASVGSADFESYSATVFGDVSDSAFRQAKSFFAKNAGIDDDTSPELDTKQAIKVLQSYLDQYRLKHWKIKTIEDSVADIQVTKRNSILVRKGATFQEQRLQALLVHEIGTHVFRFENGKRQPFRIFERGTAGYLRTEEGLAVWNQNQLDINLGRKVLRPALQVIAIHLGKTMGFREVFETLKNDYNVDDDTAWHLCVKTKRGLIDVSRPGVFTKDAVYFLGLQDIQKFVKKGGAIKDLYMGKIAIEDLEIIKNVEGMVEPKFVV